MLGPFLRLQKFAYNFKDAELKWRSQGTCSQTLTSSPKFYCLSQFPYPSGSIHLGHARVYFISDTIARYQRMMGCNVLHPIGWDSFGLPAENAAIQRKLSPELWTRNNIQEMKQQLGELGIAFDWDRELATHQLQYYRWTQHLFLILFNRGLAYKKEAEVNWDPIDKTVLANEQVDINGRSWRSGAQVEKRKLNQWFFRITAFAERLLEGLEHLKWPNKVKQMQRGWIGLRRGFVATFEVKKWKGGQKRQGRYVIQLTVFSETRRGLHDCRFIVVPSQSCEQLQVGVCIHPVSGREVYVYSTRDAVYESVDGFVGTDTDIAHNLSSDPEYIPETDALDHSAYQPKTIMLLRDWLISRQRYWGTPIPIIYCDRCGTLPSPLPVILPDTDSLSANPLTLPGFKECQCPKCSGPAVRQSDTLDTFVDSSWYFARFLDPHNQEAMFSKIKAEWMPVDAYVGGIQHAIMHLLYSRFVYKVLADEGMVSGDEPFSQLVDQGLVKGKTYKLAKSHSYISRQQAETMTPEEVVQTFEKMSKSKFNGVSPLELTQKYGSDALRLALFSVPYEKDIDFTEADVKHKLDFIHRVFTLHNSIAQYKQKQQEDFSQQSVRRVKILVQNMQSSMQKYSLHVYVARCMELYNILKTWLQQGKVEKELLAETYEKLVRVLYPVSPHLSQEITSLMNPASEIRMSWPDLCSVEVCSTIEVSVSVNGRYIKRLKVPKEILVNDLVSHLKQDERLRTLLSRDITQMFRKDTPKGHVINILCP